MCWHSRDVDLLCWTSSCTIDQPLPGKRQVWISDDIISRSREVLGLKLPAPQCTYVVPRGVLGFATAGSAYIITTKP
jgi:hypothetical protein